MKDIFALYLCIRVCVCVRIKNEYQQFRKEEERAKIQREKK